MRYLPVVIELVLLVYCLIDCVQTDGTVVRNLPKLAWVGIIILLPIIGPIAWLVAGRPERANRGRAVPWRSTDTAGFPEYERPTPAAQARAEIDDRLAQEQARVDREHEDALRRWEDSLRERESRLRPDDGGPVTPSA